MTNLATEAPSDRDLAGVLRRALGDRRVLILAAAAMAVPAIWLGWPWLVAAGLAPILLALAPCAAMCALGMCAMKGGSKATPTAATEASGAAGLPLAEQGASVMQSAAVPVPGRNAACCGSPAAAAGSRER